MTNTSSHFQFWIVLNSFSTELVEQQQVQEQMAHSISSFAPHNSSPILWFIVEFNQSTKHLQLMTWLDEGERKSNWKGEQRWIVEFWVQLVHQMTNISSSLWIHKIMVITMSRTSHASSTHPNSTVYCGWLLSLQSGWWGIITTKSRKAT
jgi:hypothetical protein